MATWHAEVTLTGATLTQDARDQLAGALPAFEVTGDGDGIAVAFTVDASTLRQATDSALRTATDTIRPALHRPSVAGVRVISDDERHAELERPARLALVDATMGGEVLGVTRQRFEELARTRPDFPPPVAELTRGKVYTRESIEAFDQRWDRKRTGRPPKHA